MGRDGERIALITWEAQEDMMNKIPEEPQTRPDGRSVWSRDFTPDKRLLDGKSTEPLGSAGDPILLSLDERSGIN